MASQFRCTSKSVDRLRARGDRQCLFRYCAIYKQVTYYAGNRRSFKHVDAMRISASNGVISSHQSRTAFHDIQLSLTVFPSSVCGVTVVSGSDTVSMRGFASLNVARLVKVGESRPTGYGCSDMAQSRKNFLQLKASAEWLVQR